MARLLQVLKIAASLSHDLPNTPSSRDLAQVIKKYHKRMRKGAGLTTPQVKALQQCLELVLKYQVYQVWFMAEG